MNKKLLIGAGLVLVVLILALWLLMRGDQIAISITVKNSGGVPLSNAKVSIESETRTTDEQGTVMVPMRVKAGDALVVTAEWQGKQKTENVRIENDDILEKSADVKIVFDVERPKVGWVKIQSPQSPGVSVTVNGTPQGEAPATVSLPVSQDAVIHAGKQGFEGRDTSVTVTPDTIVWVVNLVKAKKERRVRKEHGPLTPPPPKMGTLTVRSAPPGAAVRINGQDESKTTPLTKQLEYGIYTVEASMNGKTEQREVDLNKSTAEVAFSLPTSRPKGKQAKLQLKSVPPGAKIKIDGQEVAGVTPLSIDMEYGDHNVELSAGGKSQSQAVRIDNDFLVRTIVIGDCVERVKQAESRMNEAAAAKRDSLFIEVDQILSTCDSASLTVDMFRRALYFRGVANYNLRKFSSAIDFFQQLAKKYDRTNPLVYYYLGLALEKNRKYYDAISAFNEIERHRTFLSPDRRDDILGEAVFSIGNDYYVLSTQTEDPDLKGQFQDAAVQNLSEFVSDYCSGTTKSHQRCDRANQIIHDLEK